MKVVRFIRQVFRHFPRLLVVNLLAMLAVGIADIFALVSVAPVVDYVMDPTLGAASPVTMGVTRLVETLRLPVNLTVLMLLFIGLAAARNAMYVAATYVMLRTKYAAVRQLIVGAFRDFFDARWSFFTERRQGALLNTFSREVTVVGDSLGAMTGLMASVIEVALYLVVPMLISWQVAGAAVLSAIALGLPFILLGEVSYRLGQRNTATANDLMGAISENISAAKVVLGFGNQDRSGRRVSEAFEAHRRVALRSQTLGISIPLAYYPLGLSVLAIALFVARHNGVPLSETVVILYAILKIVPLIGLIVGNSNAVQNAYPSFEQVERLREEARSMHAPEGGVPYQGFVNEVALEDVTFAYPNQPTLFEHLALRLPKGRMVAIVGPSGAGKSTLADLLMGLAQPNAGEVTIDGRSLSGFDHPSYRRRIGYVPQDPILFNMSVRDNLLWAQDGLTEEDLAVALSKANAAGFVARLERGYDTVVGDRGARLSGGQVQRIALARALVRQPDLLILDEATSSLDSQSERLIQEAIESIAGETTIVVIAHRLATVKNSDYVYVIDDGRVVEEGTFSEMMADPGSYLHASDVLSEGVAAASPCPSSVVDTPRAGD